MLFFAKYYELDIYLTLRGVFMKKVFLFVFLAFGFISISNSQVKHVLLEQHTGAWCGWCVDGSYVMDQLHELYPETMIGVKVHNGDSMVIAEQATIAGSLGLTGYPTGAIDRRKSGTAVFQDRNNWTNLVESALALTPKVDVKVTYNLNQTTRQLVVKVYATMISTVTDPLRFNVYVVEDSCSGKGTGWDQSNYLTNRAGYESNPYYKLPAKIVGYQHMKVVRAMLGGVWGTQGSFTQPANAGQVFVQDFFYTVPANMKLKDIKVVGLVSVESSTNKEVLNCDWGKEGEASIQLTSTGPSADVKDPGTAFVKSFELKNVSNLSKTFKIAVNKSTRTPADWNATVKDLTGNEVVLAPNGTQQLTLSLTPGTTIGMGDATMLITDKDNPNGLSGQGTITCYSSNITNIEVIPAGEKQYSMKTELAELGYQNFINLTSDEFTQFSPKLKVSTLIFNTGSTEGLSATDVDAIINAVNNKIPLFICGNQTVGNLNVSGALPFFGVDYYGYSTQGYGSSPWRVWLSGESTSPITKDLGTQIEGNLIKYLITLVNITAPATTKPFMHFTNAGKRIFNNGSSTDTLNVAGADAIFGVAVEDNGTRYALLSITPYVIVNKTKRTTMIDRVIKWLKYELNSVEVPDATDKIFVSPNPATDKIEITMPELINSVQDVRIYNSTGVLIDVICGDNLNTGITYNTTNLPSGQYTIAMKIDGNLIKRHFVVVK